jgi:hypothetical protein
VGEFVDVGFGMRTVDEESKSQRWGVCREVGLDVGFREAAQRMSKMPKRECGSTDDANRMRPLTPMNGRRVKVHGTS